MASETSIIGSRAPIFWGACVAMALGVLLHLPMLAMAHRMGNHLAGMPMDAEMWIGMALIIFGVPAAIYGALPPVGRRTMPLPGQITRRRTPPRSTAGTSASSSS